MLETKMTVNIALQGRVMFEEEVCQSDRKLLTKHSMIVEDQTKNGKRDPKTRERITFYTRKSIPATQTINMSKEAYQYMSSNDIPEFSNKGTWSKMSKNQRIEAHLKELAKSLDGELINFTVYPD